MQNKLKPAPDLQKPLQEEQDSGQQGAIGAEVRNHKGELLGRIKKITYDEHNNIQYIILHCANFFGGKNRYFAVPASSGLMELSGDRKVILKLDKNDLKLAKGISADRCPPPSLSFGPSIYELYNFSDSSDKNLITSIP